MATRETSKALYAELDAKVPGWKTRYPDFGSAVVAAGERARELYGQWIVEFTARSRQVPELPKVKDKPVFSNSNFGQVVDQERWDEPGKEQSVEFHSDYSGKDRAVEPPTPEDQGRNEDTLWHPKRHSSMPHSDTPFRWKFSPPRENSCIKCY